MAHYALHQRCWPTGSMRTHDVAAFLSLLRSSCGVSTFELSGGAPLAITPEALDAVLRSALAEAPFPGAGADEDVYGRLGTSDEYVRVDLHSGTSPGQPFIDHYNVDFGAGGRCLSPDDFKRAVSILRPFEAFVAELNNEEDLDSYNREQRSGFFTEPALIRWFHYFDRNLAARIGGIEHCLKAPAGRVEPFLDGVLIELVDGPFDSTNRDHVRRQLDVMTHLGMDVSAVKVSGERPGPPKA